MGPFRTTRTPEGEIKKERPGEMSDSFMNNLFNH